MSRSLSVVLALLVIVALAVWLMQPGVTPDDLGPARRIATHPASTVVALGRNGGAWTLLDLAAPGTSSEHRWSGQPWVSADGVVYALIPGEAGGGLDVRTGAEGRAVALPEGVSSDDTRLVGLAGPEALPVLVDDEARAVWWLAADGWRRLADDAGPARPERGSHVALTEARAAVAFLGAEGWEAWTLADAPARRLARDCRRGVATFSPEGDALVVDGPMMNLYRLELADGRLHHMADGNLGDTARVPWTAAVRGDPPLLVAPQFDLGGWLQLVQTNFSGGGKFGFSTGFEHHYLPTVSPAGRWLSWAQSPFDLDGDEPFEEDLYLFDFDDGNAPALALGKRAGGEPHRGPAWAAAPGGVTLLWVAGGRAWRLDRAD